MLELNERQEKILKLKLDGLRNKEIGRRLDISEGWVEVTYNIILKILGLRFAPTDDRSERFEKLQKRSNEYFHLKETGKLLT